MFIDKVEERYSYYPGTSVVSEVRKKYVNSYDYVAFAGVGYYEYMKFDADFNVYFSDYEETNVVQFSPSYGYSFGNYYSKFGSFYLKGTLNYIKLSDSDAAAKSSYTNVDLKLDNYNGTWVTSLEASLGKSAYKVANDGFVVYNLGEEYKNSYALSVGKKLKNGDFVSAKVSYSEFEETEGSDAASTSFLINYSHKF